MKLDTRTFSRGSVLDVRQEGNRLSVAGKSPSSLAYEVEINFGETASTVKGSSETGEPVDYLVAIGPTGVTVTDELKPGTVASYATPRNFRLDSREAQQNLAVNVISSLIGVPLPFDPSQISAV